MSGGFWYDAKIMRPKPGNDVFVDTNFGRKCVYYGEHGYEIPLEWWSIGTPVILRWRYGRA
jgi:hypothetical protein